MSASDIHPLIIFHPRRKLITFFPSPEQVTATDADTLRTAGLSARKADYGQCYLNDTYGGYSTQLTYIHLMLSSSRSFCEVCGWPIINSEALGGQ